MPSGQFFLRDGKRFGGLVPVVGVEINQFAIGVGGLPDLGFRLPLELRETLNLRLHRHQLSWGFGNREQHARLRLDFITASCNNSMASLYFC